MKMKKKHKYKYSFTIKSLMLKITELSKSRLLPVMRTNILYTTWYIVLLVVVLCKKIKKY